MTNRKAIETLEEICGYLDNCPKEDEIFEALSMAEEALEKQTPKKPLTARDERSESWQFDDVLICPSCGMFICWISKCKEEHYRLPFCPDCYQVLDWSDIE